MRSPCPPRRLLEQPSSGSPRRTPRHLPHLHAGLPAWLPDRSHAFRRSRRDHGRAGRALSVQGRPLIPRQATCASLLHCIWSKMALLGSREMSDVSPQIGPKRALIRSPVTNRDFMSPRPTRPVSRGGALCSWARGRAGGIVPPPTSVARGTQHVLISVCQKYLGPKNPKAKGFAIAKASQTIPFFRRRSPWQ